MLTLITVSDLGFPGDVGARTTPNNPPALVATGVTAGLLNWVPVDYAATCPIPSTLSEGIANLEAAIASAPGEFVLVGCGLGAVICSTVYQMMAAGVVPGVEKLIAAAMFGNPARQNGASFPGAPNPGGQGIMTQSLMTNTPEFWHEYANPADWVTCTATDNNSQWSSIIFQYLCSRPDFTGELASLQTCLGGFEPAQQTDGQVMLTFFSGADSVSTSFPHGQYAEFTPLAVDGVFTSAIDLAIEYLESLFGGS
jgi:hypothetical protein